MAREFEERNQKAKASVASIVGITIASMMPVALNRMSRWADAMGPLGSRTPSEQPPSMAMQIKGAARTVNRIKFLPCSLGFVTPAMLKDLARVSLGVRPRSEQRARKPRMTIDLRPQR